MKTSGNNAPINLRKPGFPNQNYTTSQALRHFVKLVNAHSQLKFCFKIKKTSGNLAILFVLSCMYSYNITYAHASISRAN